MPWAELFFRGITELGSDYIYMTLIAVGFWTVNKRASILTALVLAASSTSNYWLKITFKNPRPPATNWLPGVQASNYSLPSGHAQNSTALWGWLGIKIKTLWMSILSTVLIVLIGLSRIYIGVHWLEDVFMGWAVGLLLLIVLWRLEKPARSVLSKYNPIMLYLALALFGLAAMILTELLSPVTTAGLDSNFGTNGGLIIGLGVGLALEKRYVDFEIAPKQEKKWRTASKIIIGLILVSVITLGLAQILPTEVYWLRAIRYALATIVVVFFWPLLFNKFMHANGLSKGQ